MSINDPLGDMLARIRNAQMRYKAKVTTPASKLRERVLDVLAEEGYVRGYARVDYSGGKSEFEIELKYFDGEPVIKDIKRVSTPGRRVYSGSKAFDLCFGEGMWAELRPHGVDVLNLILGRTDTPELRRWLASRGAPVPEGLATAEDVARVGLERLPHGPVHNWGLEDEEQGRMPQSAAERRNRILAMEAAMQDMKAAK